MRQGLLASPMTPQEFIRKWKPVALTERATAQQHFFGPVLAVRPSHARRQSGRRSFHIREGRAENRRRRRLGQRLEEGFLRLGVQEERDLGKALEQLTQYAAALKNPPLHVACDTHIFRIETRWTNEAAAKYQVLQLSAPLPAYAAAWPRGWPGQAWSSPVMTVGPFTGNLPRFTGGRRKSLIKLGSAKENSGI